MNQASDIKTAKATAVCETHGEFQQSTHTLFTGLEISTSCPDCLKEKQPEGGQCSESEKRKMESIGARIRGACIPKRFEGKSFDNYIVDCPESAKMLKTCRRYAENFAKVKKEGISLILHGNVGTGKSHLSCAIANKLAHDGYSSHYTTIGKAIGAVKDTYRKGSEQGELEVINGYSKPDLLILDEVGIQYGTDAEKNILFAIINARYEAMKPTIMISNLDMVGLTQYAGERVIDRMKEGGGMTLVFNWGSHRGIGF